MYFIPRNNRLYAFFIARPLYAWYGITAALILLCCVLWAAAVYLPVHAHWQSLAVQQSFLIEQRNRCEVVKRDIEQLSLDTQSLSGTLKDLMHTYQSHAGASHDLLSKVGDMRLHLLSCVTAKPVHKAWYSIHPYELQVRGGFNNLCRYLNTLGAYEGAARIAQVTITHRDGATIDARLLIEVIEVPDVSV